MDSQFLASLLGIESVSPTATVSGGAPRASQSFGDVLSTAMEGSVSPTARASVSDIVFSLGAAKAGMISQMNTASTLDERLALAVQFRDTVVESLNAAGYSASAGNDVDKIVVDGVEYDILRSINTLGAKTNVQLHRVTGSGGGGSSSGAVGGSISSIVYAAGKEHANLVAAINNASTLDERIANAEAFRNEVAEDLEAAGYNVVRLESVDKISIDGELYDVLSNVKSLGTNTTVQVHYVGGADGGKSSNPYVAIMAAVSNAVGLLEQINASSDVGERNELAEQAQELVVSALSAAGFTASAGDEADKIVLNGTTYDFISRLNSAGETARFQALRVG